jgi:hypothetical protein
VASFALVNVRALVLIGNVRTRRIVAQIVRVVLVGNVRAGRKAAQIARVIRVDIGLIEPSVACIRPAEAAVEPPMLEEPEGEWAVATAA